MNDFLLLLYLHLVKRLEVGISLEEDPSFEEVGKHFRDLVFGEDTSGHAEYLIKLLERSLLRFTLIQFC